VEVDVERTADTLIGRVLDGRYRVGPRIARGGMATVYEATDLRLDRTVAVKVMHEGLADDDEFVRRFQREARSAARLAHHNVVAVFDTGEDAGTLFLVMEFVPGLTLRDLIRKEAPMAPGKALSVIEPVLAALAAAHDAGILHRDVKPENVLLADDGRVKVADFGLARAINSETQHTATGGVLIGTVSYLSPELVVDGRADARADVYAAGVIIYEMLTGRKPHQADSPIQVAYKHVHEDVPAPSVTVPGIPAYVDALVARATSRNADLRPADARVLLHQVRRVRNALDQGVVEDADLVADLTPTGPIGGRMNDHSATGELPLQVIEPQELAEIAEYQHDSRAGATEPTDTVYDQERDRLARPVPPPPPSARRTPDPVLPPPERRRRRGAVWLVVVLVLAVAAALAGWYFGIARYTVTPGVIDMSRSAAQAKLDQTGLDLKVKGTAYSETVVKSNVVSTDPAPGDRVAKDGDVGAVISRGPERHQVPDLRGKTLDDAQQQLQDDKLTYGHEEQRFDDTVAKGLVLTTDPAPGTTLHRDAAVDVVVSKGPKPIAIPDLTGKPGDRAKQRLTTLGFTVDASEVNSDTVPSGKVISQIPRTGNGVKGDKISLVVSKGPVLVAVPNVKGAGLQAATDRLTAAGFKVKVQHASLFVGLMYVVGSDPSAGTMARKGSTVTVSIV
jgi:beta-lactam-binding protein with PASTA domain/serine/threonine protein kinase